MNLKKFLIVTLSVFAAVMLAGVLPSCAERPASLPASEPEQPSGPKFVAHKGYWPTCVENTEPAFRAAANLCFYGIETDLRKTKDGRIVCWHDATVYFSDGSEKRIADATLAELLAKPLKNSKNVADAGLCTFETYLQACKAGNKVAVIELKDYFNLSEVNNLLEIIDAEYDRAKVTFIAFNYFSLLQVREADDTIPLQFLTQSENDATLTRCLDEGIALDARYTVLTEETVRAFHAAGLTVNAWTVNDEETLLSVTQMGVDYVTTDVFYEE